MKWLGVILAFSLSLAGGEPIFQSLDAIRTAAAQGNAEAQFLLGMHYVQGANGVKKHLPTAAQWLTKAGQ